MDGRTLTLDWYQNRLTGITGKACRRKPPVTTGLHALLILVFSLVVAANSYAAPTSDDFNSGSLNTNLWTVSDPVGDGTVSVNGTQLIMSVPSGNSHDVWTSGNDALGLYQSIANVDFDVAVKFESAPNTKYQIQGLQVRESATTFLRFDFFHDGKNLKLFHAHFVGGTPSNYGSQTVATSSALFLRVIRSGSQWSLYYGIDGFNWTLATTLTISMSVNEVGPFVGNAGPNPAMSAIVDYVFDSNNPIVPEDGEGDTTPPQITAVNYTPSSDRIRATWTTDEPATSSLSISLVGVEIGTASDPSLKTNHDLTVTGLAAQTLYTATVASGDAESNGSSVGPQNVTTTPPQTNEPQITAWYGDVQDYGDNGQIQRWVNILGKVTDPDGVTSLSYRLNGGNSKTLTVGPTDTRVHNTGDFNADIDWDDLDSGANYVEITALDGLGYSAVKTITVNKTVGVQPGNTINIDWATESSILDVAQVVDGNWYIDPATEGVRTAETGYDRLIGMGDISWTDYEITTEVTAHSLDPDGWAGPSYGPGLGIITRWTGHYNWQNQQPFIGWNPLGGLSWVRWTSSSQGSSHNVLQHINGVGNVVQTNSTPFMALGIKYIFKMEVRTPPGQGSFYRFKYWEKNTSEPGAWQLEYQAPTSQLQAGSLLLVAHEVDATFGPVMVTQLSGGGGPDTTPPQISGISVSPSQNGALISWSTDEPTTGLVDYGETVAYGSSVTTTLATNHSVSLTGLTADTLYNFAITATDPSTNSTESSNQTFTTSSSGGGGTLISDEFDGGTLNGTVWTIVDPNGDGTFGVGSGALTLSVPSGNSHDIWTAGNDSLRAMQNTANEDLIVEVKFNSVPTQKYQLQGIVVEQDANDLLRFDYYSDGNSLNLFAATFSNGTPLVRANIQVTPSSALYLKITRSSDQWTLESSSDGVTWSQAASFTWSANIAKVGPFSGNAGPNPAFEAVIDYFRVNEQSGVDTEPPVISGISATPGETTAVVSWSTNEIADGLVRYGITTGYELGSVITSSAGTSHAVTISGLTSQQNYHFQVESTDGSNNTSVSGDQTFTTSASDTTAPLITDIQSTPSAVSAVVSWTTDEPTTGTLAYGETTGYELGTESSASLSTNHTVTLSGLATDQLHHFSITANDASGNQSTSGDQVFITDSGTSGSGLVDDLFDGSSLSSVWSVGDPVGDGTIAVAGSELSLSVPSGSAHDIWTSGNDSLRVTQISANTDFEVDVHFTSTPSQKYQLQGVLVEQDSNDLIRFDVYSDGKKLKFFAATFSNGSPSIKANTLISAGSDYYIRVNRTSDQWTASLSYDGVSWSQMASFSHNINVARVGPYAGNAGANPAFTAQIDEFIVN